MNIKNYLLFCLKMLLNSAMFTLNLYIAVKHMIDGQGAIGWFVATGLWFFITCTDLCNYLYGDK